MHRVRPSQPYGAGASPPLIGCQWIRKCVESEDCLREEIAATVAVCPFRGSEGAQSWSWLVGFSLFLRWGSYYTAVWPGVRATGVHHHSWPLSCLQSQRRFPKPQPLLLRLSASWFGFVGVGLFFFWRHCVVLKSRLALNLQQASCLNLSRVGIPGMSLLPTPRRPATILFEEEG